MSGSNNAHPGAQSTPASGAGGVGGAGAGMAHSDTPKDQSAKQGSGNPEVSPDDNSTMGGTETAVGKRGDHKATPEQANASGDGTFGDGKFDAAAPGAAAKAMQLESKARTDVGEEGKINVSVN